MDNFASHEHSGNNDPSPLVAAVSKRLVALIGSNALRAGEGLPAERQLAADFAVSRGIVRAAIKKLTAEGLIESKPNCRPIVREARRQRTGRRHIGIWLWPNAADFAGATILKGIQSCAFGEDVRLVIGNAPGGDWNSVYDAERRFLEGLSQDREEAGAIVWYLGGSRNMSALVALRESGVPLVFIDRQPPEGFTADFVGTNNERAAETGVQSLIDLGHRRIGLISNVDRVSSVVERERGYHRALAGAGIEISAHLTQRDSLDDSEGVETALDNLLGLSEPPTALFCINDHLALRVHESLGARGLTVPGDISVLGFDGLLRWVPGGGYLTTLTQDFQHMGQLAAELILERMDRGKPDAYKHLLLDAPLVHHGSTARPSSPFSPMQEAS